MYQGIYYAFRCEGKTQSGESISFELDAEQFEGMSPAETFAVLCECRDRLWSNIVDETIEWGDFRFVMTDQTGVLG